jgi:hypothetical protein
MNPTNPTTVPAVPSAPLNPEGKPFDFSPLSPAYGLAGEIRVRCTVTKERANWNDAARQGWAADCNGRAFSAYYSPAGMARVTTGAAAPV